MYYPKSWTINWVITVSTSALFIHSMDHQSDQPTMQLKVNSVPPPPPQKKVPADVIVWSSVVFTYLSLNMYVSCLLLKWNKITPSVLLASAYTSCRRINVIRIYITAWFVERKSDLHFIIIVITGKNGDKNKTNLLRPQGFHFLRGKRGCSIKIVYL